jgi:hypothetical protein
MNIPVHWKPWAAKALIRDLENQLIDRENRLRERGDKEARLQDQLAAQDVKIERLQDQISTHAELVKGHSEMSARRQKGIQALLSWIQAAHRIDVPKEGTILEALQKAQNQQT